MTDRSPPPSRDGSDEAEPGRCRNPHDRIQARRVGPSALAPARVPLRLPCLESSDGAGGQVHRDRMGRSSMETNSAFGISSAARFASGRHPRSASHEASGSGIASLPISVSVDATPRDPARPRRRAAPRGRPTTARRVPSGPRRRPTGRSSLLRIYRRRRARATASRSPRRRSCRAPRPSPRS